MKFLYSIIWLVIVTTFLTACSLKQFIVKETFPLIEETERAILAEANETLARQSLPFAIKFAEGIYGFSPNPAYAAKLSLLYAAYGFTIIDEGPYSDFDLTADFKQAEAKRFYEKSHAYALLALDKYIKNFSKKLYLPEAVPDLLARTKSKQTEVLFWLNFSWAMLLFQDLSDATVLAHANTIRLLAERVVELDDNYYYGAAYALLMAYYGARSEAIGGNLERTLMYYDLAQRKSAGFSLIPHYIYMRFVAVQHGDLKGFTDAYRAIERFTVSQHDSFAFMNVVLKRKAAELYKKREVLF